MKHLVYSVIHKYGNLCLWDTLVFVVTKLLAVRYEVQIPARVRNFSFLPNLQTGSGAHPASHLMRNGVLPLSGRGVKLTTNLQISAKFSNEWSYVSTPLYDFIAWNGTF